MTSGSLAIIIEIASHVTTAFSVLQHGVALGAGGIHALFRDSLGLLRIPPRSGWVYRSSHEWRRGALDYRGS